VHWNDDSFPAAWHRKDGGGYREPEPVPNRAAEQFGQAFDRKPASHRYFEHSISRAGLGCAFLGKEPTFDRLSDILMNFVHCLALRDASR